jgi:hypothetical protein
MTATRVFRAEGVKPDGSRYEMVVYEVPQSSEYPEGERYSFQYMAADDSTLLRYDNYVEKEVGRHHRHAPNGSITAIEYKDYQSHVRKFRQEVNQIHARRQQNRD